MSGERRGLRPVRLWRRGRPRALQALCAAARCVARAAARFGSRAAAGLVLAAAGAPACADADFDARVAALLRLGHDRPDAALADLPSTDAADAAQARTLRLARGLVLARSGRDAEAVGVAGTLRTLAAEAGDRQAEAAAAVVQAEVAFNAARLDVAAALALQAIEQLEPYCAALGVAPLAGEPSAPPRARCELQAAWAALRIAQQHAARTGVWVAAAGFARRARDLAAWAGDDVRLGMASADAAWLGARHDGLDAAQPLLQQARRLAARTDDPWLAVHVRLAEAQLAAQRRDADGVRRLAEDALPLARRASSPRLEASVLTFLSDAYAKLRRPKDALAAAERGLPIVRRHGDRRTEIALVNNAGLAKIGLGRIAEGKADLARVEELAAAAGLAALRAEALREYDEALAAAGDAAGALELYHRERRVSAEVHEADRDALLKQLRQRGDVERQRREIDLLARDNELKAAELANQALLQRVWSAAALLLGLSAAVVVLLYRRVRRRNLELVSSQALLRVQSERDPLTQLANRRHFLERMQSDGAPGFEGALLLVDIDHFKRVNDRHGHAAGDAVLCEVAQRLRQAVRDDDLVVRWGGEEFLVLASKVPAAHAEALAERVLALVGTEPVVAAGGAVPVTVSIGYAHFPLPPRRLPVDWERAVNLADMALYTAKNQGRNRAVGIVAATAQTAPELRRIEKDFDLAWHEGRVTLKVAPGPLAAV